MPHPELVFAASGVNADDERGRRRARVGRLDLRSGSEVEWGGAASTARRGIRVVLEHTVKMFVDHYNRCRPHRSLALVPPYGPPPATSKRTIN
jgi:hypothetical protein